MNNKLELLKDKMVEIAEDRPDYADRLAQIILRIGELPNINVEICGNWCWVSGDTKPHKSIFNELKMVWASKKHMWYVKPKDYRKQWNRPNPYHINDIREQHGSLKIK